MDEVQATVKKYGRKRAETYFNSLSGSGRLLRALESEIGRELLAECIEKFDSISIKIVNQSFVDKKEEDKSLAEYRVYRRILETWADKVISYEETLNKIKEI